MRALVLVGVSVLVACSPEPVGRVALPVCPDRMVHLADATACIDRFEAAVEGEGDARVAVPANGRLPATDVTWADAERACLNAGLRLCGAREWHRACAGEAAEAGGRAFPYGETFEPERCNQAIPDHPTVGRALAEGGAYARCVSPEGVHDLVGNVGEWLADTVPSQGTLRELRGGNYTTYPQYGRCVTDPRSRAMADFRSEVLGFRCCADAR